MQSLTYLWNADQASLFDEIISSGIEAVVVKVAALGLSKEHLGKTLSDVSIGTSNLRFLSTCFDFVFYSDLQMRSVLLNLNRRYGVHICGEGGEYETFVVDCPLFKKKIVLDETKVVEHSKGHLAPVAYLSLCKLHLENK